MKTDYSRPEDQYILRQILVTALAFIETYPDELKHVTEMKETILSFIEMKDEN